MTFGQQCVVALKAFRGENPDAELTELAGMLPSVVASVIDREYDKMIYAAKVPRMTKAAVQGELFDALCAVCGYNAKEMTRAGKRAAGVALADIRAVMPDLTVLQIESRAAAYKRKHPTWELTPSSLAKHWGEFGGDSTRSAKRDTYCEPPNWRETAKRLYPDAKEWIRPHNFDELQWLDVRATLGETILKATT